MTLSIQSNSTNNLVLQNFKTLSIHNFEDQILSLFMHTISSNEVTNHHNFYSQKTFSNFNFTNLISLDLSDQNINTFLIEKLSLSFFKNLKTLNLSDNNIGFLQVEMLDFQGCEKLETLILHMNNLKDEGVIALGLHHLPNLRTLDLSYNKISDLGAAYLSLGFIPKLTELDISHNQIHFFGAMHLGLQKATNLQTLNISNNQLHNIGAFCLADNLPSTLTNLDISTNFIGSLGLEYLCNFFPRSLKHLNLSSNPLFESIPIAFPLKNKPQLTSVALSCCNLKDKWFQTIVSMLPSSIKKLDLKMNHLQSNPAPKIFKKFKKITHIDLSFNEIQDDTITLKNSPSLKTIIKNLTEINLSNNKIAATKAKSLKKTFKDKILI